MNLVIELLLENIRDIMNERTLKQRIRELRFPATRRDPLFEKLAKSISPHGWSKVLGEIELMKKLRIPYDYIQDEVNFPCNCNFTKR